MSKLKVINKRQTGSSHINKKMPALGWYKILLLGQKI